MEAVFLLEAVREAGANSWRRACGWSASPNAIEERPSAATVVAATPNNASERTRVRRSRRAFPPLAAQLSR